MYIFLDTDVVGIHTNWSHYLNIPFLLIGITLIVHLYTLTGYIGVFIIDILLRKLQKKIQRKSKKSTKYSILIAACCLFLCHVTTVSLTTLLFEKNGRLRYQTFYQWLLIFLTIHDDGILDNIPDTVQLKLLFIFAILIGFQFVSVLLAAILNVKHKFVLQALETNDVKINDDSKRLIVKCK